MSFNREENLMKENELELLRREIAGKDEKELLAFVAERFGKEAVFATSLGAEDQALTDLIARNGLDIPIVTLDTGRLFPETYDLIAETEERYGVRIEVFAPDAAELEALVNEHGVNCFRKSKELRKLCCKVRKLSALRRALAGKKLWICGLRRDQSVTRFGIEVLEDDPANGLLRLNPLADWSESRLWNYIQSHHVPYNVLHDKGYPSIGCACCTRAVRRVEDVRAGRWYWEEPEHRECGLHVHHSKEESL